MKQTRKRLVTYTHLFLFEAGPSSGETLLSAARLGEGEGDLDTDGERGMTRGCNAFLLGCYVHAESFWIRMGQKVLTTEQKVERAAKIGALLTNGSLNLNASPPLNLGTAAYSEE